MKSPESTKLNSKPERHEMNYTKIDRTSPEIMSALAEARVFHKQGVIRARKAIVGEVVITTLANGSFETSNPAAEGDWVVTNPSGEQYINTAQEFVKRYEPMDESGVFKAKGSIRAIQNPFGKPIEIMASWGSPQFGDANCFIADSCEADGSNIAGEPYLIDGAAFAETYK
jgi:hypothetical protein